MKPLPNLQPFLRIPPFPGARMKALSTGTRRESQAIDAPMDLLTLIREARVGGNYWAAQPDLPSKHFLVRTAAPEVKWRSLAGDRPIVIWPDSDSDPWHMLTGASAFICEAEDEARLVAAACGVPTYVRPASGGAFVPAEDNSAAIIEAALLGQDYRCPFTGNSMSLQEAIDLSAFWRRLIDANRDIVAALGFAFWKQGNVAPLLWGGAHMPAFARSLEGMPLGVVAVWRSKASVAELKRLEKAGVTAIEVEDGFLRSQGLGADCVPPLSITVDRLGAYFDPDRPSELENILQGGTFSSVLLDRARRLRQTIVTAGLGKYGQSRDTYPRPAGDRLHILVTGQVEDDRAVLTGGAGLTFNLELLRRVRQSVPDAYIIYKPHPDVVGGHRQGAISNRLCHQYADRVELAAPIAALIDSVDEVHVNTSLSGFEALLRGKRVVTHGVPFYAGWGLTSDLGPVPARRTARRTLDELVAAALLIYPRYLDPVTGLPCPAEIVINRLTSETAPKSGMLVRFRQLQGRVKRGLRRLAS